MFLGDTVTAISPATIGGYWHQSMKSLWNICGTFHFAFRLQVKLGGCLVHPALYIQAS